MKLTYVADVQIDRRTELTSQNDVLSISKRKIKMCPIFILIRKAIATNSCQSIRKRTIPPCYYLPIKINKHSYIIH